MMKKMMGARSVNLRMGLRTVGSVSSREKKRAELNPPRRKCWKGNGLWKGRGKLSPWRRSSFKGMLVQERLVKGRKQASRASVFSRMEEW